MTLKFRPHHFLCTLGFQGRGYDNVFISNFREIKDALADDTAIEVVDRTDDICSPCPHKRETLCTKQVSISALDKRHEEAIGFKPGKVFTWAEAKRKMATLDLEDFHQICHGCSWKELGLCEEALTSLKAALTSLKA